MSTKTNTPRTNRGKSLSIQPVNAPVPADTLPSLLLGEVVEGPKETREGKFPAIAATMAGFYSGLIPAIGEVHDLTTTKGVMRFLDLCEQDTRVKMARLQPVITYTHEGTRYFDTVDLREGEGDGDYIHRVSRKGQAIARKYGTDVKILRSMASFEEIAYQVAQDYSRGEEVTEGLQWAAMSQAYRHRDVLLAIRTASAYTEARDGSQYRLAQVLNLPKKETVREVKRLTTAERITKYRKDLLTLCYEAASVQATWQEGDAEWFTFRKKANAELIEKANNLFYREGKRYYPVSDLRAIATRIMQGEEVASLDQ